MSSVRAAVVGHVEWIEFVPVERVPRAGEIVGALESWEEAGGGGSVAAVQLSLLADSVLFFTVARRRRARAGARWRSSRSGASRSTRRSSSRRSGKAFTYVDETGERTITTIGPKHRPARARRLAPVARACALRRRLLLRRRRRRARGRAARASPRARPPASSRRSAAAASSSTCSSGAAKDEAELLPPGRPRPGAEARRHDLGCARRLGAAGRPVHRRAAPGRAVGRLRRGRLLRRRPHVRARRRARHAGGARVRRALRRRARSPGRASTPSVFLSLVPRRDA